MKRSGIQAGAKSLARGSTFSAERKPLERVSSLKSTTDGKGKGRAISPASKAQREKAHDEACVVCRHPAPNDPAHLIDRSLLTEGQDDPRAVVPLCRLHHDEYDEGGLDLLPYISDRTVELAFAVLRFGFEATYRRVTNERRAA